MRIEFGSLLLGSSPIIENFGNLRLVLYSYDLLAQIVPPNKRTLLRWYYPAFFSSFLLGC